MDFVNLPQIMKTTTLFRPVLLSLCTVGLLACAGLEGDDDMIWDFGPIVLYLSVENPSGDDLLNPQTKGSIAQWEIKALYRGETYEKDCFPNRSRAYMPHFRGLQTELSSDGQYYLSFGEFGGGTTFDKEQVTIDWGDGTRDVITFSNRLTWNSKNKPVITRKCWLNGEKNETNCEVFKIIK